VKTRDFQTFLVLKKSQTKQGNVFAESRCHTTLSSNGKCATSQTNNKIYCYRTNDFQQSVTFVGFWEAHDNHSVVEMAVFELGRDLNQGKQIFDTLFRHFS